MVEKSEPKRRETRRERFKRLTERRVVQTIRHLRLISNLANRNNYEYDQGDVDKIFRTLERELKQARLAFDNADSPGEIQFKLKD